MNIKSSIFGVLLILPLVFSGTTQGEVLIPAQSGWYYNDTGADLGTAWIDLNYDASSWAFGSAQLGYGDGDEQTIISYGSDSNNKYPCYYFRHTFNVSDPSIFQELTLQILRDDGCVVYLNGVEIARDNMPDGDISYNTYASSAIEDTSWHTFTVDAGLLSAGQNIVAVEIHQGNASSSDVSFDLELDAAVSKPTVTLDSPPDMTAVTQMTVDFLCSASDPSGLASAELYIGDAPQIIQFSGSAQTADAQISENSPDVNTADALSLNIDGMDPHAHVLMKFPNIIGSDDGQIPAGTSIKSALLEVNCTNPGDTIRVYRLTEDWIESEATWNQRKSDVSWSVAGADGPGSRADSYIEFNCSATGSRTIDITPLVQAWSDGTPNYGIVVVDTNTDGVDFPSSESDQPPMLTIEYGGSDLTSVASQSLSGNSDTAAFSIEFAEQGDYIWNCLVANTLGEQAWAPENNFLRIDSNYPDQPVLINPTDGATDVPLSPELNVQISDPNNDPMDTAFWGGTQSAAEEFTIAVIPDTQKYVLTDGLETFFTDQTQWIVDNASSRNIVFVTHEGDLVDTYDDDSQWQEANASMSLLDDVVPVVPFGVLPGNHDQPTALYNSYFPVSWFEGYSWYGGHYGNNNDNNFELFSAGGMEFIILHLQYAPPTEVISWADTVLDTYPDRIAIITTHGYLSTTGTRDVHGMGSTEYIWNNLIAPNNNVHFVLCGHEHGEFTRTDTVNGRQVHQLLADYQDRQNGGNGWMRLMRFVPSENKVYVKTYSPSLDQYETDANSQFVLDFPMDGYSKLAEYSDQPSGSSVSHTWTGLQSNSSYEWYVTLTDSTGRQTISPTWSFATLTQNQKPTADSQNVTTDEDTPVGITLSGNDPDGDTLDYAISTPPANGTLSGTPPSVTYTPSSGFTGTDQFTFTVSDGSLTSDPATVEITVNPVDTTAPVITAPAASGITSDSATITWNTDEPADSQVDYGLDTTYGSSASDAALVTSHSLQLTGLSADTVYHYRLSSTDEAGNTATSIDYSFITLTQNQKPTADSQNVTTDEDTPVGITLSGNDPDGDTLDYAISTPPSNGGLSGTPPSVTYTPNSGFTGTDQFTFTVSDGSLTSDPATVTITVNPVVDTVYAYATQNPIVTIGVLGGNDITALEAADDGLVQTLDESPNGKAGASSLLAEYQLQTSTDPALIQSMELQLNFSWSQIDADDPLQIHIWNGTQWEDITSEIQDGSYTPATVDGYIDSQGVIRVQFSDTAPIRKEKKDTLTLDLLCAVLQGGEPDTTPPAVPSGLSGVSDDLSVQLEWTQNSESDLAGYRVYRSTAPESGFALIGSPADSTYADQPGAEGTFYYAVSAIDVSGNESALSTAVSVAVANEPPAAPTGLAADAGDSQVTLTWNANTEGDISGYNIYRSLASAGEYLKLNASPVSSSGYTDTDAQNGTTYYYQISAVDQLGAESPNSGYVSATPQAQQTQTIHVDSIDMSLESAGKNWKGVAAITVLDQDGNPAGGALVTGDWYYNGSIIQAGATATTGSDGVASSTSSPEKAKSGESFTFVITNVELSGFEFDQSGSVLQGEIIVQ